MSNLESREAKDVIEELIPTLKIETRQPLVLPILVSEGIAKYTEQIVIGFTDELPELIEAMKRIDGFCTGGRRTRR